MFKQKLTSLGFDIIEAAVVWEERVILQNKAALFQYSVPTKIKKTRTKPGF